MNDDIEDNDFSPWAADKFDWSTAEKLTIIAPHKERAALRFNPNHDPATGEFSSGGGSDGKKEKRIKRRERLRRRLRKQAKELKDQHRDSWMELQKEQRRDRRKLAATHRREHTKITKKAHARLEKLKVAGAARERNQVRKDTKKEIADLKEQHAYERGVMKESQKSDRDREREYHKEDWDSFRFSMKEDIKDAGFKRKSKGERSTGNAGLVCSSRGMAELHASHRLSIHRLHKASNAESILRACLRDLGWSRQYRRGELTGAQHLELLEAIRQYARAWLRHEAEQFTSHYISYTPKRNTSESQARIFEWTPGPGGYLILQERPGWRSHVARFFRRVKNFVRENIIAGLMSLLGPEPLSGDDLDAAERAGQRQDQFFDRFYDEVKQNPPKPREPSVEPTAMTPGEFVARVEKYGDSGWQTAQQINRSRALSRGAFKLERRVLGNPRTEHCNDCPPLAALGWQPIGTLPHIGESECGPRCLCHFEWTDSPDGQPYMQGNKQPEGPLTKEQLDKIMSEIEWSASVGMGTGSK